MASSADNSTHTRRVAGWSMAKIASAMGGELVGAHADLGGPSRVCTDTRSIASGELFVALRGERFDAHDFLDQAEEAGALAAVVDRVDGLGVDLPLIVVDDTLEALAALGHAIWREATEAGLHTIDVTGSNGKTTVKEMLARLWQDHGAVFATPGNLNNHIGVPLVLCGIPADCDHLIVEMGANAEGEISHLVSLAPGSERIITSIGVAHIEGFGSLDGIRRAKAEIFEGASPETTAIVPHAEAERLVDANFVGRVITVGRHSEADLRVETLEGGRVRLHHGDDSWALTLPIPGAHHELNLATSFATLLAQGLECDQARCEAAMAGLQLPEGRWRVVEVGEVRFVDDAYNANPSSVRASFDAFMRTEDGRERPRVAIIGEMLELGDEAANWHRQVAQALAADEGLAAFVSVGAHAGAMAAAARASAGDGLAVLGVDDPEQAARWLASFGPAFVFLKASRGARLETVVDLLAANGENVTSTDRQDVEGQEVPLPDER
jgi:UDP-N-acetylmuramoyl-tripeptide--D-alanyl-D-alanine ligase